MVRPRARQKQSYIKILSTTAMPSSASSYFMAAATSLIMEKPIVSARFIWRQIKGGTGSSDFMINGGSFTYGGKTYSGFLAT